MFCDFCFNPLNGGADTFGKIGQNLCYECWSHQQERERTGKLNLSEHRTRIQRSLYQLSDRIARIDQYKDADSVSALRQFYAKQCARLGDVESQMQIPEWIGASV